MRERIREPLAPEVITYLFNKQVFGHLERDFKHLMWINQAHAVMLLKQDILPQKTIYTLLTALKEMERDGIEQLDFDPNLEDTYLNMEHVLIQKVGREVGGRLHTARSRNDLYSTMTRLAVREQFLKISKALLDLREIILNLADSNSKTVIPLPLSLKCI